MAPAKEKVPLGHWDGVVVPDMGQMEPAGHIVQLTELVAPVRLEYLPAAHTVQFVAAVEFEYVPAAHNVHAKPPLL